MTPSEQILKTLKGQHLTRAEVAAACQGPTSTIESALKRLHSRGTVTRTKPGNVFIYRLAAPRKDVDTGSTLREALRAACATHPELAEILLSELNPPAPMAKRRRVRRTPTTAKHVQ